MAVTGKVRAKRSATGRVLSGLLLSVLAGLLLAGIVHIATIMLVPRLASTTAIARIEAAGLQDLSFTELGGPSGSGVNVPVDRQFQTLACPFNLAETPVALSAPLSDVFWTLAIFDSSSRNVYSLNDRLTASAGLELVLVNASQLARLREIGAQELEKRIVVELDFDVGFALFRVFTGASKGSGPAANLVRSLNCEPFEPDPNSLRTEEPEPEDNRV